MSSLPRRLALVVCSIMLLAPAPASAQFGGLMKKARDKIAEKAVQQAGDELGPVTPGEQLTDELVGKVVIGAQAADRVLGERDRVQATRETLNKELAELATRNAPVHRAYDEVNGKISECRDASLSGLSDARNERFEKAYEALGKDPLAIGKMQLAMQKYGQAMNDATQKKDPAALQKAQFAMLKEITGEDMFGDPKKDSIATDAKCGKLPAKPAALTQEEVLQKKVAAADDSIRTLEAKAVNVGAKASGIESVRYLQLKERALGIVQRISGNGREKFADAEVESVRRRLAELEKVKRAL